MPFQGCHLSPYLFTKSFSINKHLIKLSCFLNIAICIYFERIRAKECLKLAIVHYWHNLHLALTNTFYTHTYKQTCIRVDTAKRWGMRRLKRFCDTHSALKLPGPGPLPIRSNRKSMQPAAERLCQRANLTKACDYKTPQNVLGWMGV